MSLQVDVPEPLALSAQMRAVRDGDVGEWGWSTCEVKLSHVTLFFVSWAPVSCIAANRNRNQRIPLERRWEGGGWGWGVATFHIRESAAILAG